MYSRIKFNFLLLIISIILRRIINIGVNYGYSLISNIYKNDVNLYNEYIDFMSFRYIINYNKIIQYI